MSYIMRLYDKEITVETRLDGEQITTNTWS